jgi:hypothetical protein
MLDWYPQPDDFGPQELRFDAWIWFNNTDVLVTGSHFAADPSVNAPAGWCIESATTADGADVTADLYADDHAMDGAETALENSRSGLFS